MKSGLVWLRRDLRLFDSKAIYTALQECDQIYFCFVYDTNILNPLLEKGLTKDRRVDFIWQSVEELDLEFMDPQPNSFLN